MRCEEVYFCRRTKRTAEEMNNEATKKCAENVGSTFLLKLF